MRVIFRIPEAVTAAMNESAEPLAYVEWFTPFHRVDTTTGMYMVSRSTRQHRQYASVIPVSRIARSCHLIPQWGSSADRTWSSETVLEKATTFFVNPYLRHHDFILFRYLVDQNG